MKNIIAPYYLPPHFGCFTQWYSSTLICLPVLETTVQSRHP